MSDDLLLPQVPEPKPGDSEDVSWALSTAEAMWARGDHSEGVKWIRRAAEAAADAEQDERSLELAKAAADLTGLVTRRMSRASIHIETEDLMDETPAQRPPPKPAGKPAPPKPGPTAPKPNPSPSPNAGAPSVTKQVATPSRPPAPLPSSRSQPPPAIGRPITAKAFTPSVASKPAPAPPKSEPKKASRKSKVNLEAEARAAFGAPDTSPEPLDKQHLASDTSESPIVDLATAQAHRGREIGGNDPTIVGNVNDILAKKKRQDSEQEMSDERTADEWDASPTQNLTGDELGFPELSLPKPATKDDRKTSAAFPPPDFKATSQSFAKPARTEARGGPSSQPSGSAPRPVEPHDPGITTTQAVRVVVWRDGNGVHVAPAGTVVSAITVDAVLVALDANADLTAWLTQKGR